MGINHEYIMNIMMNDIIHIAIHIAMNILAVSYNSWPFRD